MAQADTLAPSLLVALPQLMDPNFRRAVVLVTAHEPDGSMGFVVNRPLPVTVSDVLDGLSITWKGEREEAVHQGGPVMTESGWVLFEQAPSNVDDAREILPGTWLTASVESLRRLAGAPPRRFRLLLGYAGWGAGQLENELADGSWLIVPATADILFDVPPERMWGESYRRLGIDPSNVVPGGGVQ